MNNKIIRIVHFLLFFNSLIGILTYLDMAIISIFIWGMGIPGFVFLFVNGKSAFSKKTRQPQGELVLSIAMIVYNFMIYIILSDFNEIAKWNWAVMFNLTPWIFPLVNMILSVVFAGAASLAFLLKLNENNAAEKDIMNEETTPEN